MKKHENQEAPATAQSTQAVTCTNTCKEHLEIWEASGNRSQN